MSEHPTAAEQLDRIAAEYQANVAAGNARIAELSARLHVDGATKRERVLELLDNPEAVLFDGLEDAIIGVAAQHTKPALVVYDERAIIDHFMDAEEMTEEEALDWYGFNVACLWAGEGTPLILRRVDHE